MAWRPKSSVQITGSWEGLKDVYALTASGPQMDYIDNDCLGHEPAVLTYSVTQPATSAVSMGNFSFSTAPWLDTAAFSMDIGTLVLVFNKSPPVSFWFQATTEVVYFGAELSSQGWSCGIGFPGLTMPYKICQTSASFRCSYGSSGYLQATVQIC
jgi:hypothetical protein